MTTRKRKADDDDDEEELQALPSDVSDEEEEYVVSFQLFPFDSSAHTIWDRDMFMPHLSLVVVCLQCVQEHHSIPLIYYRGTVHS